MKKMLIAMSVLGLAVSPTLAGDLEEYCVGYTTESGGDPSGCSCLADAADDAMAEELMGVESEADMEMLSDASKEAIAACWPDA
ncbi:hypothetical protein PUV54_06325 [Hyphococcus flavus]|uniref:Uncharacterized protein n=1 Tax=Hyphococcus flavus TaxID=1866326 RepID=A0AAE9ZHQ2_9PROT|nr:hypothetical protein [Hyphococcus flavus]WDI32812.1 hypothetical protein PUV54_06325 [Hyphococcus flavus]